MFQSCQDLQKSIQHRHVWVDQVKNCLRNKPVLKLAIPDLTTLSEEDLKTFAIRQAKLRRRWDGPDDNSGFVRGGQITLPALCLTFDATRWLLPGGNQLLVRSRDALLLYQVHLSGERTVLSLLNTVSLEKVGIGRALGLNMLLLTTSPHPICVCIAELSER